MIRQILESIHEEDQSTESFSRKMGKAGWKKIHSSKWRVGGYWKDIWEDPTGRAQAEVYSYGPSDALSFREVEEINLKILEVQDDQQSLIGQWPPAGHAREVDSYYMEYEKATFEMLMRWYRAAAELHKL